MKKDIESKASKKKILSLNIFMIFLLFLLTLSVDKINNKGIFLIYISTWILILHIWLGAYYIVKYLKAKTDILNVLLDIVPLVCMFFSVLNFNKLEIWSNLFAILFATAIIKYARVYLSGGDKRIREYTLKKIKNEVVTIPLFILLAILAYIFEMNGTMMILLQSMTLASQVFFAVWLIYVKKVYQIFK